LLPFILWPIPHRDPIGPILGYAILAIGLVLGSMVFLQYQKIARAADRERLSVVVGYAASVLLPLYFFPGQAELGLTVLAVLAFGDGSATLGGLLWGGRKLPWNFQKTIVGSCCFVLAAAPLASLVFWGEAQPRVSWTTALIAGLSATLVGAIVESIPSRINDNIRVGVAAAVTLILVHAYVLGWA
jgi:dolichol kinase